MGEPKENFKKNQAPRNTSESSSSAFTTKSTSKNRIIDATIIEDENRNIVEEEKKKVETKMEDQQGKKISRSRQMPPETRKNIDEFQDRGVLNISTPEDREEDPGVALSIEDLEEIEKELKDYDPEQLAKNIMDYYEAEERKNEGGASFADGVFEAATKILEEERNNEKELDFRDPEQIKLADQEELRRMFESGRNFVENRMVLQEEKKKAELPKAADPKNRIKIKSKAEQQLAELEIRLDRASWEEPVDGSVFDLFESPPEEEKSFNALSVNYPGAPAEKRDVDLPEELGEAVQYARFAAGLLTQLQEKTDEYGTQTFYRNGIEMPLDQVENLKQTVRNAVKIGLIDDPILVIQERGRLELLVDELSQLPGERRKEVVSEYKDLLLSDRFVMLINERLINMRKRETENMNDPQKDEIEREVLVRLTKEAMLLVKEVQATGAELEVMQLEVIRSICQVAMDPKYVTEQEAAYALTDTVRDMLPLLDETFVAYLKYAIAEEEARLARRGQLEDPKFNRWLCVLKIVQNGVYAELGRNVNRHVENIWYILRMKTRNDRKELLRMIVKDLPTMDVRPFQKVVDNIVGALGASAKGEFDGFYKEKDMVKKIMQLSEDIEEVLSPEQMDIKARDADKWYEKKKKELMQQRKRAVKLLESRKKGKEISNQILGNSSNSSTRERPGPVEEISSEDMF